MLAAQEKSLFWKDFSVVIDNESESSKGMWYATNLKQFSSMIEQVEQQDLVSIWRRV